MSRREWTRRVACAYAGCKEVAHYRYDTHNHLRDAEKRAAGKDWYCTRHDTPEEVLSPSNPERTVTLTAARSQRHPNLKGLFWDTGSGFIFGPGFKAYADDFPEGTRIVITYSVLLP